MIRNRKRLYIFFLLACISAYIWLFVFTHTKLSSTANMTTVCMFKSVTGIPCPSCGSSRAIVSFMNGNLSESIYTNPVGLLLLVIILLVPLWIVFDLINESNSLFNFYKKTEYLFKRKSIAISAAALILINWIWNISKGL